MSPSNPLERVHVDIARPFQGHYFLILVDAYSKWTVTGKSNSDSFEFSCKY